MKHSFTAKLVAIMLSSCLAIPFLLRAADQGQTKTLTGEVVDLMCYVSNGAKGEGHKGCAEKCIKNGGPVGLLVGDQVYLVVGDHEPANELLASKAAQTITVTGKLSERGGLKLLSNVKVKES